jgi:hypothetical protein
MDATGVGPSWGHFKGLSDFTAKMKKSLFAIQEKTSRRESIGWSRVLGRKGNFSIGPQLLPAEINSGPSLSDRKENWPRFGKRIPKSDFPCRDSADRVTRDSQELRTAYKLFPGATPALSFLLR